MGAVIRIDILGDSKSAQRAARDTSTAYDRLGGSADKSSGKVGRLGGAVGAAAKRFGPLAALVGAGAVLKIGKDSLTAASDVEQAFGAIDAVFGKNAAKVKSWAKSAANDVGLAKSEYGQLASVTGAMLKNTGIEDYSTKTKDLIKLGADLSAQFGGSTKTAIEAIGSLMRGETDPIEKYGVSIKQSAINAELARLGLDKLTGSARTQAEQQARLKLLFEQTGTAQGAFARESDTLANSQQKLGAKWENLKAIIGEKLLPVATKLVTWFGDAIEGSNATGKAARKVGEIYVSYVKPILESVQKAWKKINDAVNEATGSNKGMEKILRKVGEIAEKVAPIVGKILGKAIEHTADKIVIAVKVADKLWGAFKKVKEWADKILGPIGKVATAIGKLNLSKLSGAGAMLGGLFGSQPGHMGTLARGAGSGVGLMLPAPTVQLYSTPQISISLDSHKLDGLIRVAVREEISRQVVSARRGS